METRANRVTGEEGPTGLVRYPRRLCTGKRPHNLKGDRSGRDRHLLKCPLLPAAAYLRGFVRRYLYCTLQLEARPCVVADTVREIGLSPSTSQELTMHTGIQLRILYQALISGPHPNSVQDTIFWRPAQAL